MSEKNKANPSDSPKHNRRESDRTGRPGGVQAGGRRKSDRANALPRSNAAKIAIACSFLFSTGLVAWAFTLPFRSGSLGNDSKLKNLPQAELANLEYEARLSADAYVDYTRNLDRRLLDRVQDKYHTGPQQPQTNRESLRTWQEGVARRKQQLEEMQKDLEGKPFEKGTIQWQNQQDLEKIAEDAPRGA